MDNLEMNQNMTNGEVPSGNQLQKIYKKEFSKLGWAFLLGTLVIYAVQYIAAVIVQTINPYWLENPNVYVIVSVVPMYLIGMPFMIFLIKRIPGDAPRKHSMKAGEFLTALIMCFSIMYLSNIVGTIITASIGVLKGGQVTNIVEEIATNTNPLVNLFYMVLCAPILEEFIFRKLIIDRTVKYGEGVAILLSGLMFGLFHGNLSQFVYAFTIGIFLAFIYAKTGKLIYAIIIHMIINFMGSIVAVYIYNLVDMEAYEAALSLGQEAVMEAVAGSLAGWLIYGAYAALLICLVLIGAILLIVKRKKFALNEGEIVIPKGNRIKTVLANSGMAAFTIFWVAMIVLQLFE